MFTLSCSQSNMELGLSHTINRNQSYDAIRRGELASLRVLHFDHNPQVDPVYVTKGSVKVPWKTPADALKENTLPDFSGACWYFGEALSKRMSADALNGGMAVPIGLIESAYGGTMIESWFDSDVQLSSCSNITCTAKQTIHFTKATESECFSSVSGRKGAGANGQLYNGMVLPFVNMSVKGFLWYQGENNLAYMAGNVLDRTGYACMLPALIENWRRVWSAQTGTTDPNAPFGIVQLADSTDEGWGCNVPQMHWAQTANVGYAPNTFLPHTFMAAAHDLPDPWDDGCEEGAKCCVDTGEPVDPTCGPHRGYLIQTGKYPGVSQPVTPSAGTTIHPRIKRQIGQRLAQAAWSLVYGHTEVAWTGPVLAGCALTTDSKGQRQLRVRFNASLLQGDQVVVADYNRTERASVTWLLVNTSVPADADKNFVYANRKPWWGDDYTWINADISPDPKDPTSVLVDVPTFGTISAIRYGHGSPKGHPQDGHDKICCGDRNFGLDPCLPESCPISSRANELPAMPFHAQIVNGKCKCFAPQTCDS